MDNQYDRLDQQGAGAKVWRVIKGIGRWIYNLRSLFFAIPVVIVALGQAAKNMARLPEEVGLLLLADGTYQQMVSREMAVIGPLAVTALCLLMMFISRRFVYPWLISIFSLVLPLVIYITNVFPA